MKLNWFTRKGVIYLPSSIIGWVIFALAVVGTIYMLIDIGRRSHSVSDTMINFVFNLLLIGLVYTVIAYFTEAKERD